MAESPNSGNAGSPENSDPTKEQLASLKQTLDVELQDFPPSTKQTIATKLKQNVQPLNRTTDKYLLSEKVKRRLPPADADSTKCMQKYFKELEDAEHSDYWLPNLTAKVDSLRETSLKSLYAKMVGNFPNFFNKTPSLGEMMHSMTTLAENVSDDHIASVRKLHHEYIVLKILGYDTPFDRTIGASPVLENNPVLLSNMKWLLVDEVLEYLPNAINAQNCRETADTWDLLHTLRNNDFTDPGDEITPGYPFLQHFTTWDELKSHWDTVKQHFEVDERAKWDETFNALDSLKAFDNALNLAALFEFLKPQLPFKGFIDDDAKHFQTLMINKNELYRGKIQEDKGEVLLPRLLRDSSFSLNFLGQVPTIRYAEASLFINSWQLNTELDALPGANKIQVLRVALRHVAAATSIYSKSSLDTWWKQSVLRRSEYNDQELPVIPAYLKFKNIPIQFTTEDNADHVGTEFSDVDYRNACLNNIWEREQWPKERVESMIESIEMRVFRQDGNLISVEIYDNEAFDNPSEGMCSKNVQMYFRYHAGKYAVNQLKDYLSRMESVDHHAIDTLRNEDLICGQYQWEQQQMSLPQLQRKLKEAQDAQQGYETLSHVEEDQKAAELSLQAYACAEKSIQATLHAARWFQRGIFLCDGIEIRNNGDTLMRETLGASNKNTPCIFGFARIIIPCLLIKSGGVKELMVVIVTRTHDKIKFHVCGNQNYCDELYYWLYDSLLLGWKQANADDWCDEAAKREWHRFFQYSNEKDGEFVPNMQKHMKEHVTTNRTNGTADTVVNSLCTEFETTSRFSCEQLFRQMEQELEVNILNADLYMVLLNILSASHVKHKSTLPGGEDNHRDFHNEWRHEMFYDVMSILMKHEEDLIHEKFAGEFDIEAVHALIAKIFNSVLVWVQHLVLSKLEYHDPLKTTDQGVSNSFAVPRAGRRDLKTRLLSSQWKKSPHIPEDEIQVLFENAFLKMVGTDKSDPAFNDIVEESKDKSCSKDMMVVYALLMQQVAENFEELHLDEERNTHPRESEPNYIQQYIHSYSWPRDRWADIPLGPHRPRRVAMPVLASDAVNPTSAAVVEAPGVYKSPPDSPSHSASSSPIVVPSSTSPSSSPRSSPSLPHTGGAEAGGAGAGGAEAGGAGAGVEGTEAKDTEAEGDAGAPQQCPNCNSADCSRADTCPVWKEG